MKIFINYYDVTRAGRLPANERQTRDKNKQSDAQPWTLSSVGARPFSPFSDNFSLKWEKKKLNLRKLRDVWQMRANICGVNDRFDESDVKQFVSTLFCR